MLSEGRKVNMNNTETLTKLGFRIKPQQGNITQPKKSRKHSWAVF